MKRIKILVLSVIVMVSLSCTSVLADSSNAKGNINVSKKTNYNTINNKDKKLVKQIYLVSSRIDKIELSLNEVQKSMEKYFNTTLTDTTTPVVDTTTTVPVAGAQTDTTTTVPVADPQTDTTITVPAADIPTNTTVDSDTDITNIEDELSDEFEKEYENEDNSRYNSFSGKLNAISNKLNTVEKNITKIKDTSDSQIKELQNRITTLNIKIVSLKEKLTDNKSKALDKINNYSDKKLMPKEEINDKKTSWKINFTKALDEESVNSTNIMILDKDGNLLDTEVSLNSSSNVNINAKDGFVKGEEYSLIITGELKSKDGQKLNKLVEKKFLVK